MASFASLTDTREIPEVVRRRKAEVGERCSPLDDSCMADEGSKFHFLSSRQRQGQQPSSEILAMRSFGFFNCESEFNAAAVGCKAEFNTVGQHLQQQQLLQQRQLSHDDMDDLPAEDVDSVRQTYIDCADNIAATDNVFESLCDQFAISDSAGQKTPSAATADIDNKSICLATSTTLGRGAVVSSSSRRTYHCRVCRQVFEGKSDMQRHIKDQHQNDGSGHKCFTCLKTFPTSQQLTQHNLVHNNVRKYPCSYCDKTFKQLSHVQQHQRIHTGDRPYKCLLESCTKAFRQLSSLQQHMKGHNYALKTHGVRGGGGGCRPSSGHQEIASVSGLTAAAMAAEDISMTSDPEEVKPIRNVKRVSQTSSIARPSDLTCQVCEEPCADEERFFRHIHREHADYWRVFSGGRPLEDFIETVHEDQHQHHQQQQPPPQINANASRGSINSGRAGSVQSSASSSAASSVAGHIGCGRSKSFVCKHCKRTFVQEKSFEKHVASHKLTTVSSDDRGSASLQRKRFGMTSLSDFDSLAGNERINSFSENSATVISHHRRSDSVKAAQTLQKQHLLPVESAGKGSLDQFRFPNSAGDVNGAGPCNDRRSMTERYSGIGSSSSVFDSDRALGGKIPGRIFRPTSISGEESHQTAFDQLSSSASRLSDLDSPSGHYETDLPVGRWGTVPDPDTSDIADVAADAVSFSRETSRYSSGFFQTDNTRSSDEDPIKSSMNYHASLENIAWLSTADARNHSRSSPAHFFPPRRNLLTSITASVNDDVLSSKFTTNHEKSTPLDGFSLSRRPGTVENPPQFSQFEQAVISNPPTPPSSQSRLTVPANSLMSYAPSSVMTVASSLINQQNRKRQRMDCSDSTGDVYRKLNGIAAVAAAAALAEDFTGVTRSTFTASTGNAVDDSIGGVHATSLTSSVAGNSCLAQRVRRYLSTPYPESPSSGVPVVGKSYFRQISSGADIISVSSGDETYETSSMTSAKSRSMSSPQSVVPWFASSKRPTPPPGVVGSLHDYLIQHNSSMEFHQRRPHAGGHFINDSSVSIATSSPIESHQQQHHQYQQLDCIGPFGGADGVTTMLQQLAAARSLPVFQ